MIPKAAKTLAIQAGLRFWYDEYQHHWVLQDEELRINAMFICPGPLKAIVPALFVERYIEPQKKALALLEQSEPYRCPQSKHPDGNHDRSWFNGGPCTWCGAEGV